MATKSNREVLIEGIDQQIAELRADKVRDDIVVDTKISVLEDMKVTINAQPKRGGKKKVEGAGK